ncbi:hypothetical protein N7G274_000921 [Stereocaulon virgatum]|uniref:Uncharacterized protein n=1 Tax=Stereocaulon virgatum TaxID=373712 RepID=A0ABR4AMC6_9LECA
MPSYMKHSPKTLSPSPTSTTKPAPSRDLFSDYIERLLEWVKVVPNMTSSTVILWPLSSNTHSDSSSTNAKTDPEDQDQGSSDPTSTDPSPSKTPLEQLTNATGTNAAKETSAQQDTSYLSQAIAILPINEYIDNEEDLPPGFPYDSAWGFFTFVGEFLWRLQDLVTNCLDDWTPASYEYRVWCNGCGGYNLGHH